VNKDPIPILEYDPSERAVVEPGYHIDYTDAPAACVPCFFQDVIDDLRNDGRLTEIASMGSEMGRHPLYELDLAGFLESDPDCRADLGGHVEPADARRLAVFQPGLTAPFAAAMLEEVVYMGCRSFVACGGAGVLLPDVDCGHVIVPTSAVRDEGTSYHYLPPGREVEPSPQAVAAIAAVLAERGGPHLSGKVWTTDAFYRETRAKVDARREEGCIAVEMEAAAFFAVAKFRGVTFGQLLYGGDDLSGEEWDHRGWQKRGSVREGLFRLAVEACLRL
jgi:uridine phosphorylase